MKMKIHRGTLLVGAVATLVGFPLFSGLAFAVHPNVEKALGHAREAVTHGMAGHADVLVQHAEAALKDANAATVKSPHKDEGIIHLKEAVTQGKAGHVDVATEHAEEALTHLAEVK